LSCDEEEEEEEIMMMGGACLVMSEEELIHKSCWSYSGIFYSLPPATSLFCFHLPLELESRLFLFLCLFNFCFTLGHGNKTTKSFGLHFAIVYINY